MGSSRSIAVLPRPLVAKPPLQPVWVLAMRTWYPGSAKYRSGGPAHYYNPAAFAEPPVATTIGTSDLAPLGGSNTQVNGPGFRDLDFSIFKEFKVTETTRLQFRAESFNLTNTPSFNLPSNTNYRDTVNFGQSTSTRSAPREIQFALKYYW